MKKRIIITEEDGQIEVKKLKTNSKGDFEEVEDLHDVMESHRLIQIAINQDVRLRQKERQKEKDKKK